MIILIKNRMNDWMGLLYYEVIIHMSEKIMLSSEGCVIMD
jgi:hypothetical protein